MVSLNRVLLAGNLTRDPEVRYTPSGRAVSDLGMAINRRFRTSDGQDKEDTCFVDIVVWGRQAETCGEYLGKGSPALVEGRLQFDQWEKDGQKNSKLKVVADRVQFLGSPRSSSFGDGSRSASSSSSSSSDSSQAAAAKQNETGNELADDDNLPF
jgi:single-strand DNA-binding protein